MKCPTPLRFCGLLCTPSCISEDWLGQQNPTTGEGVPCRELITQMMKEGEKSSKGKMVVLETTQGLSKAGSCSHPEGWGYSGRRTSTRGSTLQIRAQELGCQSGDHRACVLTLGSSCLSCLWLCGATCFWVSSCRPHQQPVVCSQIHETTSQHLLSMETHTWCLI